MICSKEMEEYFNSLKNNAEKCYFIAGEARKKKLDPEVFPEIPLAEDMASRVESLVGPDGIADRIRSLSNDLGREELSIQVAKEVVSGKFKEKEKALDQAIRTGLAVLTEGVLVAPLDGIAGVKIKRNFNGTDYLSIYFAGPIRSAGGTAQAMSVLIADVVRRELGLSRYLPTNEEIERYKEEIQIYKSHARTLQYTPTSEEIEIIASSCPVCIDGEGTEKVEVFGNRDLARVETNRVRGGMCLVIAEGLCLKAPKIQKHVKTLGIDGWEFVDRFVSRTKNEDVTKIAPNPKYMKDIVTGRPVFSHPSRKGGFRLRYGRCRNSGLAAVGINPSAMHLLDGFLAVGTQLKIERPGKAGAVVPCDSIDGPVVLLKNGDLIQVNSTDNALKIKDNVKEIVDLGEILISYGEFLENNHPLMQGSYCSEWWEQELEKAVGKIPEDCMDPAPETAFKISEKHGVPLHPKYCLFWEDLSKNDVLFLRKFILENGGYDGSLILSSDKNVKEILIKLCALHKERNGKIVIENPYPLIRCCGLDVDNNRIVERNSIPDEDSIMSFVSKLAGIPIMEKSLSRIGSRMGRPEKAKERKMSPPVHVLFPLGMAGGMQRLVKNAVQNKTGGRLKETIVKHISVPVGLRICEKCRRKTFLMKCECGGHTNPVGVAEQSVNVGELLEKAEIKLGESIPDIKGVLGLISKNKTPEPIEKGALRAKHNVFVYKDGTIRFDMSNVPLTHFKPKEIGAGIEKMREMGYIHDYHSRPLKSEDQIVELKGQDFVVSKSCMEYLFRAAKFVDELLEKFYGLPSFYNAKKHEDIIGHLIIGLSPHTSAGVLGRIIGWTNANAGFAHPFYHAAKRRNCLHPDTKIIIMNERRLKNIKIEHLFNHLNNSGRVVDDFGTVEKKVDSITVPSLNTNTGKFEIKNIKSVMRTTAPDHLIRIKTKSGREFTCSPDHLIPVFEDGFTTKKAFEISNGNLFILPEKLNIEDADIKQIDLLKEFLGFDYLKNGVTIKGIKKITRELIFKLGGYKEASSVVKINRKTLSNYVYRDSIPLNVLNELLVLNKKTLETIPLHCTVGVKRNNIHIPRIINVNNCFLRLIGYYLAEGYCRHGKECYQVCIAATEKEIVNDVKECINHVFGCKPSVNKHLIVISSRIIYSLFMDVLKLGRGASYKRAPSKFLTLPKHKVRELLKAYFAGDGSVEKNRLHVTCSSVSKELIHDIGLLLLRFGIFYRLKSEKRKTGGVVKKFYEKKNINPTFRLYYISIRSNYAKRFYDEIGFSLKRKQNRLKSSLPKERSSRIKKKGNLLLDPVKDVSIVKSDVEFLYDIEVEKNHNFLMNHSILSKNCDGDEDCVMLLLDALLNFSKSYLPDKRGGIMDAPLVLTTRIEPNEIDKEALNFDTGSKYPLELYEAGMKNMHPKEIEKIMENVKKRIGTEKQYENFSFTMDTSNIACGPLLSSYKTLGSMEDKFYAQLNLAGKIRAVDTGDMVSKIINTHLLPDMIGNLRTFATQKFRCTKCNTGYRRIPLKGVCLKCGGNIVMTVSEGGVKKYLKMTKEVAEKYNVPNYTMQRVLLMENAINSLFHSDKINKCKLEDFL
ncbi:MAG: DNA polymerase II large subunit [Thermoplasmatales archaeon]|nr:DNA polymerase II large subunit [Thermoplasmatales archaeon]